MAPIEEYCRYRNCFAECGRLLYELISAAQRIPFAGRKACEELQTILSQLIDQSRRYDCVLKAYQKEYEAYCSGTAGDDSVLCRSEKELEQEKKKRLALLDEYEKGTIEHRDIMVASKVPYIDICAIDRMIQIVQMEKETLKKI